MNLKYEIKKLYCPKIENNRLITVKYKLQDNKYIEYQCSCEECDNCIFFDKSKRICPAIQK